MIICSPTSFINILNQIQLQCGPPQWSYTHLNIVILRMSCFGCTPQYPSVKQFTSEGLILHNTIRRKHNVPPLKFAKDLVQHAQEWAEYLVKTNQDTPEVQHLRRKNIGQNITVKDSYENYAVDYSGIRF